MKKFITVVDEILPCSGYSLEEVETEERTHDMTKLVNLTPHEIRVRLEDSTVAEPLETDIVIPPTQPAARISQFSDPVEPINGIPVKRVDFGKIENLPNMTGDTVYIVSLPVAQQAGRPHDVVSPDTSPAGGAVRAPNGQIFAVRGFQSFE